MSERSVSKLNRPQSPVFWLNALNHFNDVEWRKHYRMSQHTFDFVLGLVEPHLRRKPTNWRQPLEPRVRLAIALWWYATPREYKSIGCIFGIGISPNVSTLLIEFMVLDLSASICQE